MVDFVRPISEDRGDGVVSERVAYKVHDFLLKAIHQGLLQLNILCLGDKHLDDTEPVAADAKFDKVLLDLTDDEARLFLKAAPQELLNDMCSLLVDRKLKDLAEQTVFENFLLFRNAEGVDDRLNRVGATLVCADKNEVLFNKLQYLHSLFARTAGQ